MGPPLQFGMVKQVVNDSRTCQPHLDHCPASCIHVHRPFTTPPYPEFSQQPPNMGTLIYRKLVSCGLVRDPAGTSLDHWLLTLDEIAQFTHKHEEYLNQYKVLKSTLAY